MNSIKKYDADVAAESDINSEMNTSVMDTSKDPMAELFQAVCPKYPHFVNIKETRSEIDKMDSGGRILFISRHYREP